MTSGTDADQRSLAERQLPAFREVLELLRSTSGDIEEVLEQICRRARALCDADESFVYLLDGDVLRPGATDGSSPENWAYEQAHPSPIDRRSMSGRVALDRRTVHIPDVLADPEYDYPVGQEIAGYRTLLGVPIVLDDEFVGLIGMARRRVEPVSDEQIEIISAFADQASIAIRDGPTRDREP